MVKIEMISENKLRYIAGLKGFNLIYLEKDFFLTLLLYLLKDLDKIYFKGGTALNKIFLNHTRLSEDLDFTCKEDLSKVKERIIKILEDNKAIFPKYNFEKETSNFFRLKIFYKSFFANKNYILLDVNKKASIILKPQKYKVNHFYENIPKFEICTLDVKELVAEKVRTLIMRNQPRDYYDIYNLFKKGYKIDFKLAEKKLREANQKFEIKNVFKNTKKIYSRWKEVNQITNKSVDFFKVIKKLQKELKYKK